jgi:uncharacterized membrane protein YGL010W
VLPIAFVIVVWMLTIAGAALWGRFRKPALLDLLSASRAILLTGVAALLGVPAGFLAMWACRVLPPGDDWADIVGSAVGVFTLILSPFIGVTGGVVHALVVNARFKGRERHGLCTVCGYDLRASSERCPECGTPRTHALADRR